ncbi:unnamed protein product [Adineta steineri]|uniref:Uncharacterized protein n=1 Tax=Adineta steineri TaxID=433720 RepID=A0A816BLF2_9BILA|nr:unnamed protein product [Adineta steineri]CAF1392952.1 unnamed protein product [Adineta steineri]CAF1611690.1 unnamed protein product [Adineta steineri]CAF1611736.1 unnamed protein product [Adineta steineri]
MNIITNFFKLNHRYNKKTPDIISIGCQKQTETTIPIKIQSSTIKTKTADSGKKPQALSYQQSNQPSFHFQINAVLSRWEKLKKEKVKCQQQQQLMQCIKEKKSTEYDEFDRIMEEDLGNQLQELERQEEKYYKQIEVTLEEQFKQDNYSEELDDGELERICMEQLEPVEEQNDR